MGLFSYVGNNTIYRLGGFLARHFTFGPAYVTVKTKYGLLLIPKTFRVFTFRFDKVEPEIKDALNKFMMEMDCFLNIGASEGYYLLKARALRRDANIIGFEPDPKASGILLANISMNDLNSSVVVSNIALSDRDLENVEIQTCMGNGKLIANSRTLDSFAKETGLKITKSSYY